ncbi:MAG: acyl-CoA dehydrogenase family protein [Nitrospirota bacterium]|nr:acyl-CoA dehydrogenase family protein [Nitrospirota bacterium]
MDFSLQESILEMKKVVAAFVAKGVDPRAKEIEEADAIPEDIVAKCKDMGLFGLGIPENYGGLGLGMVGRAAILEELGKTINGFTTFIGGHVGIGTVGIVAFGSKDQKLRYLPKMASGDWIGAFALTEPDAGSDAASLKTTAVKKGERYVLNGSKHFITNGDVAQVFTVMAKTDPKAGPRGISSFLVEKGFPGLRVGKLEKKMGLKGSHTTGLSFEDCEVPEENLLGKEGEGFVNALKVLTNGRAGLAARNLGSCQKLLELSLAYASERVQFGRPILAQPAIRHYLAEMATEVELVRSMVYRVAWMVDQGQNVIKEAAMVKLFASEAYNRIADKALQVHGGMGYMCDMPIERYYRDARITRIYEGTSEIQKNIIARELEKGLE